MDTTLRDRFASDPLGAVDDLAAVVRPEAPEVCMCWCGCEVFPPDEPLGLCWQCKRDGHGAHRG